MTAITLNLLAEEQLAEQASARDPVKSAAAIGATLLMLSALCGSLLWVVAGQRRTEVNLLKVRWDNVGAQQATSAGTDFKSTKSYADDLVALSRARTLYARQLALIKDLVPDSVQLSRINLALNTEVHEGAGTAGGDALASAGNDKDKPVRTARPRSIERLRLQLMARRSAAILKWKWTSFYKRCGLIQTSAHRWSKSSCGRSRGRPCRATRPASTCRPPTS